MISFGNPDVSLGHASVSYVCMCLFFYLDGLFLAVFPTAVCAVCVYNIITRCFERRNFS